MGSTLVFHPCVLVISMTALSMGSSNSGRTQRPTVCPSCNSNIKLPPAEMKKARLEMIAAQILEKLRLPARPNTTVSRQSLPAPLVQGKVIPSAKKPAAVTDIGGNMDEFYAKTTEMVKFPYRTVQTCPYQSKSGACIHFDLRDLHDSDIRAAELWVHKRRDQADTTPQVFFVSRVGVQGGISQPRDLKKISTTVNQGWISIDISHAVRQWVRHKTRSHHFHIWCATCRRSASNSPISMGSADKPFLVIHKRSGSKRTRRSINCSSGATTCCREKFYVSFRDLNWQDWVLQPSGYWANYCKGSCYGWPRPMLKYTAVIATYQNRSPSAARIPGLTPCCAPNKMSSISMLYMKENGQIVKQDVPNMRVESCGCA